MNVLEALLIYDPETLQNNGDQTMDIHKLVGLIYNKELNF